MKRTRIVCGLVTVLLLSMAVAGCRSEQQEGETEETSSCLASVRDTSDKGITSDSSDVTTYEPETTEADTQRQEETEKTDQVTTTGKKFDFSGAAFLGDSRTEGLKLNGVVTGADFYTSVGITIKDVVEKKNFTLNNGAAGTMLDAAEQKEYDRIYVMFGINELGWPYKDTFINYYTTAINSLKQRFPNAKIYVQSILPMVEKRTDNIYNNDNIRLFNTYIEEVAKSTNVSYIDVGVAVMDGTGALPEGGSNDGIHLNKQYCTKWAEYLHEKTMK